MDEKDAECSALSDYIQKLVDDSQDSEDHIDWIDQRMEDNAAKLENLKEKRCEANLLFVEGLMEHRQALEAIQILREILVGMTEDRLLGQEEEVVIEKKEEGTIIQDDELADPGTADFSSFGALVQVYKTLSSMFTGMPSHLQKSFLELGAKFDIDPDFNMLNEQNLQE